MLISNETNDSEPIPDLTKIQVVEDGSPQAVQSVLGPHAPISLCFLIDDSGSTAELSRTILLSVTGITQSLPPGSEIAIVHFSDKSFLDLPFTLIEKVDPKIFSYASHRGGTALYDALIATVDYSVKRALYRRRAIVLISDGEDNASTLNLDQAVKRMTHPSGPILYALFFHGDDMSGAELRHAEHALQLLTNACGGLLFLPVKQKGVHAADAAVEAVNHLETAIHGQTVVTYLSSNPSRDAKPRKVEVTLPLSPFELRYQHAYVTVSK